MARTLEQVDVVVIGGGVIGCATAWRLAQAGVRTIVVERGELGSEASTAAAGLLSPLAEAERADDFFRLCVASRALYPDFALELRETTGVDVEYRTEGTLYLSLSDDDDEELERRLAWQRASLPGGSRIERLRLNDVLALEPLVSKKTRWALKFPDDNQIDNRRLMLALPAAARAAGVRFMTHTEVRSVSVEQNRVTGVMTTFGELKAPRVILAAGSWSSLITAGDGRSLPGLDVVPVRGQMVALEMPNPAVQHVIYSSGAYIVPRLSGYLIAGSTLERVGYDKRLTGGGLASVIERTVRMMPALSDAAIAESWAGLRPCTPDELPILGFDPQIEGLIYATGHYRNGILLAPITAQVIAELTIKGETSTDLAPFSIARFEARSAAG
jgi:glycine oxidase